MTFDFFNNLNSLLHHRTIERELEKYKEVSDLDAMLGGNEADAEDGPTPVRVAS